MPAAGPEISVVIPTYRRPDRLARVMEALDAQTLDPARFEVIAIDNASGDDTHTTLEAMVEQVAFVLRVLQVGVNRGPAPARNLGWRAAAAPLVAFLDDDCLPDPKWLETGLAALHDDERLGVVQGRVRPPEDFDPERMGHWYHCQIIDSPTPYFEAANIFYRVEALRHSGGFDETIGWWCEDTALGWKVLEAGWGRGFAGDAGVVHEVTPRGWRWYFRNGLLERNTVRMAAEFPGFRREAFWRPWAYRREDAGLVLAVLGLLAARRLRPALLLVLPYALWRRPRLSEPHPLRLAAQMVAVDAGRSAGQLRGTLAYRTFVI